MLDANKMSTLQSYLKFLLYTVLFTTAMIIYHQQLLKFVSTVKESQRLLDRGNHVPVTAQDFETIVLEYKKSLTIKAEKSNPGPKEAKNEFEQIVAQYKQSVPKRVLDQLYNFDNGEELANNEEVKDEKVEELKEEKVSKCKFFSV